MTSYIATGKTLSCSYLSLGGTYGANDVNIGHSDPTKQITINGIVPGAGGGGAVPDPLNVSTVNASTELTTASLSKGAFPQLNIDAHTIQTDAGITCGSSFSTINAGTISGDSTITAATDVIAKGRLLFEGPDIYRQSIVGGVATETDYSTWKGLATKAGANTFTGVANTFANDLTCTADLIANGVQCATQLTCKSIDCANTPEADQQISVPRVFLRASGNGHSITQPPTTDPTHANTMFIKQSGGVSASTRILQTDALETADPLLTVEHDGTIRTHTTGSINTPSINLRADGVGGWDILQDAAGGANPDALAVVMPSSSGSLNIVDDASNPLFIQSKLGTIIQTPLNQNANLILSATSGLFFGGYNASPLQLTQNKTLTIRDTNDTATLTNCLFNPTDSGTNGRPASQWTNVNTGATAFGLYNSLLQGFWKLSVVQTADSSASLFRGVHIITDYVMAFSLQASPNLFPLLNWSYNDVPATQARPIIELDKSSGLPNVQDEFIFLQFPGQTAGETMPITITLTKMPW